MPFSDEKLSPEEKLLLFILREDHDSCNNILSCNNIDDASFFTMVEDHYLPGVIFLDLLEKYGAHFNASQKAYCKMRIMQIMEENKVKKKLLSQASQILQKEGIPVLVLKGPALDFSEKQIRYYNDLDILIPQKDLLKAVGVLESHGYEYRGSDILSRKEKKDIPGQLSWNNQFQFRIPDTLQEIEVHTNLFERKRVRFEKLDALLDKIELFSEGRNWDEELYAFLPNPEASLILLCLQTTLKRSPANNTYILRQAYDTKQLLSQGIDWDYFLSICQKCRISYYVYFSLMLNNKILNTQISPILNNLKALMSKKEKKLAKIHLNCFINLTRNSTIHMFIYRLYMPFALCHSFKKSLSWYIRTCFPLKSVQAKKYSLPMNSFLVWGTYIINPFRAIWLVISN